MYSLVSDSCTRYEFWPPVYRLLINSFFRVLRTEWRVHKIRDVGSTCGCASADYAINVQLACWLLKSLSIKQGHKYDDPESAHDILAFIEFHCPDVDEILDLIELFSKYPSYHLLVPVWSCHKETFNGFFYWLDSCNAHVGIKVGEIMHRWVETKVGSGSWVFWEWNWGVGLVIRGVSCSLHLTLGMNIPNTHNW